MKATTGSGMLEALQALENEARVVFYALQAQRKIGGERSVEDFCAYSSAYQNAEAAYEKFKIICDEVLAEKEEAEEKAAQEQATREAAHNGVLINDPLAALIAQAGEVPTVNEQDAQLGFMPPETFTEGSARFMAEHGYTVRPLIGYDAPTMAGNEASPDDVPPSTGHSFQDGEWTREEIEKHANAAINDYLFDLPF